MLVAHRFRRTPAAQRFSPVNVRRGLRVCLPPVLLLLLALPACGKKGPPLAPLIRIPGRVEELAARRLGSVVYVTFRVPAANQDGSHPADVGRVEVYGLSGRPATDEELVKHGTLVARIEVREPPTPEEEEAQAAAARTAGTGKAGEAARKGEPVKEGAEKKEKPRAGPEPEAEPGFEQGALVTITEALTPALMRPVALPAPKAKPVSAAVPPPVPPLVPPKPTGEGGKPTGEGGKPDLDRGIRLQPDSPPEPARVYVAVAVGRGGRRGAFSVRSVVPLVPAPPPPLDLAASHSAQAIALAWRAPAIENAPAPPPTPIGDAAAAKPTVPPPLGYNVYLVDPRLANESVPVAPAPHNPSRLETTTFEDARMDYGIERCYVVRTVVASGGSEVESEPSHVACITPRDTFPPEAPKSLAAVASPTAVSLIWEPNGEPDLAGYLVLRGEAPGETLQPLMEQPIRETTWRDERVHPGARYVYAVVAVDVAKPPNRSAPSNRAEVIVR
jgi:hypothetical protein